MIQNSNPANNQGAPNPMLRRNQGDDFLRLQDLFYLCLARWKWFVLSLFVTMGAAGYYLLSTPNVYQRTASLLIKDESKGSSINNDVESMFSDMGLNSTGGLSNNSNGMPKNIRPIMDSALVAMAMMQGLTSAIVNPNDLRLMETIKSCDVFKGNTLYADSYLEL